MRKVLACALGLSTLLVVGCASAPPLPAPAPEPSGPVEMPPHAKPASLRLLLAQQRYDELEAALEQFRAAALWNIEKGEFLLVNAYRAFNALDADVGEHLKEWVEERPNSYQAHTANAYHAVSNALEARGGKWARETSDEQFRVMRRFMKEAERELRAALKLQPRNLAAYRELVFIARYNGDRFGRLVDEALRAFPESYLLRTSAIAGLQPKWHGSVEMMEQFARQSQEHVGRNPLLKRLLGFPDWARGEILSSEKRFDEAILMYTKAIEAGGEEADFLVGRSAAASAARRYDMAIRDAQRALELYPWLADEEVIALDKALKSARRYAGQQLVDGNRDEAVRVWTLLLEHDPKDKEALTYRGVSLCADRKPDAGIADLERALAVDPEYAYAQQSLASCYVLSGNVLEGIKRMEALLLKAPGNHRVRYDLARLYLSQRDLRSGGAAYALLCHVDYGDACTRLEHLREEVRQENPQLLDRLPAEKRAPHVVERIAMAEEYEAYMQSLEESDEFRGHKPRAKIVAKQTPTFPAWAMDKVTAGSVKAKLFVRGDGSVAGVRILSAQPPGYFDLAAVTALLQWKFELESPGQGFVGAQTIEFKMAPQPPGATKKK